MDLSRDLITKMSDCPKCGAKAGEKCWQKNGKKRRAPNHQERMAAAHKIANETISKHKSKSASVHTSKKTKKGPKKKSDAFYASWEWAQVRYEALRIYEHRCMCCGWQKGDTARGFLCVDHIKPRSKFPALALDVTNMQILCGLCNRGKSNIYQDDWRDEEDTTDPLTAQFNATMQ